MKQIVIDFNKKKVKAFLTYFPKKSIIIGVNNNNIFRKTKSDNVSKYKGLKLCNYKTYWWIFYSKENMTGHFNSRKEAIKWFTDAGR